MFFHDDSRPLRALLCLCGLIYGHLVSHQNKLVFSLTLRLRVEVPERPVRPPLLAVLFITVQSMHSSLIPGERNGSGGDGHVSLKTLNYMLREC